MNIRTFYKLALILFTAFSFTACKKDLDLSPANSVTAAEQYSTAAGYKDALAKVYGSYSLVSSNGTGSSDINVAGISDPGETDFLRIFWNVQELSTDEDVCAWNDVNLQAFHNFNWTATNLYTTAMYDRSLFQITVCNEFIRQSSDALIASRGFTGTDAKNIRYYRAEARFLRAFQYWVLMDLFANPPFVTENDPISTFIPPRITRANLFTYIESELKAVDTLMVTPRQNEYARADQAAADALLARMYLNAQVYTGTARYTDAITYAQKVINDGYTLMPHYKNLFMADNNVNNTEVILPIAYDGTSSQNYGGTTFLVNSAHGTNVTEDTAAGIPNGGWLGNRSTQNLPLDFSDYSGNTDKRAMFGSGTLAVADELNFSDGLEVVKFTNKTSDGTTVPSPNGELVSTDFPLFRLAEMYLVYIEAVARGGNGGSSAQALLYFNMLRERAYENTNGNVSSYTLDDILNERQRELYWECFRRTDLIRYGYFTSGSYLWPWKGGVVNGTGVNSIYNIFPIPSTDILTNTHLQQNPGY
jgi:hypothetical protein